MKNMSEALSKLRITCDGQFPSASQRGMLKSYTLKEKSGRNKGIEITHILCIRL
jgi:hypothetical protein